MRNKTVLLALSGGVDSSVSALMLKRQGYNVIGAFIKCFSESKNNITNQCSWRTEYQMAKRIASLLNIKLVLLNFENEYKKLVLKPMFDCYKRGLTPNPDIACNTIIKFPLLWREAKKYGADYIATGHYARIKYDKNGFSLLSSIDKNKDQSYFLAELNQKDLPHTLFPVGHLTKSAVRKIAKQNRFPNFDKKGTRGLCFVGKLNMQNFLKKKLKNKTGNLLDKNEDVIGIHPGVHYFTIGQRIGERYGIRLKKSLNKKLYVAKKNIRENTITVVEKADKILKTKKIQLIKFHKINKKIKLARRLKARYRHLAPLVEGKLKKENKKIIFVFKKPQEQIAEGQYIVLYSGDKLVASGEIRY